VPAGEWLISRGPCGASGTFAHQCGYYEDRCAIDLTPLSHTMDYVPVLAPQAGRVFFMGTRLDSGLTVMLQHDDGRVSALMHLAKVVVGLDQRVHTGQVVAYAGSSGSSSRPHLHFHVQPNAVERECLWLHGLDEIDLTRSVARSHNLAWNELTLVDPPESLPHWLPIAATHGLDAPTVIRPAGIVLSPGSRVELPIALSNSLLPPGRLYLAGRPVSLALNGPAYTLYLVTLEAPNIPGEYRRILQMRMPGQSAVGRALQLDFIVREQPDASASSSVMLANPAFASPANWSELRQTVPLCWTHPDSAGRQPVRFRVVVVGEAAVDSGWIDARCWQPPELPAGLYHWKVFARDAHGFMNRTNQRPFVFRIR
jgi:hypothetical protein